jgi:hypothetical protein
MGRQHGAFQKRGVRARVGLARDPTPPHQRPAV